MKISRKWLSQYMDVSDLSIEQLQEKITNAGFEVEAIEKQSQGSNLIIGYVESCVDHPDSDHLHCTKVNIGNRVLDIVCGAPNVKAGQKVIVAQVGAVLPGGEIKAGKIRGQVSEGMICALFELGVDPKLLTEEQLNGIEILDEDAPVGYTDPLGYLGLNDEILDIGLTPNRSDCLAAFSFGLEAGAILNKEVKLPSFDHASDIGGKTTLKIDSKTKKCPYFLGKVIGNITIKESPKWMKELLMASGVHSINNVVDISNIVMLETGQPMHFYDKDAIPNHEITVADGFDEDYTALDGITYALKPEDCVITNQGKPIGIAGIMGGDDSKILDSTKGLIIECAHFDHVSIRNTARRLNLATEASVRYQKGIEPLAAKKALDRAVQLLIEYADATEIEETVEFGNNPYEPKQIQCTLDDINQILGTSFKHEQVWDVFKRLHFEPKYKDGQYTVSIPSYRTDMEGKADLAEEVIRIIGFDSLPTTLPLMEMTEGKLNDKQRMTRMIQSFFTSQGLQDCITYTLISTEKKDNAILSTKNAIELSIPMSEERRWIRTSILPSLLDAVSYNHARSIKDVNVFEYSDVSNEDGMESHVAFVLSGLLQQNRWTNYTLPSDFYTAKGLIEELLDRLGITPARVYFRENNEDTKHFHPYRSAAVFVGKDLVGLVGQIHPGYAKQTNTKDVIMAELNCDALLNIKKAKVKFTPISKYPSVSRDLAFVIDRNMPVEKVLNVMKKQGRVNKEMVIRNIEVFDVYQGEHVDADKKSIALSVLFQSDTHTLKDDEINMVYNHMISAIENECKAVLRS
ncbi:phenylalanine--tRNA ligase subunit beta [Floccifex sp.]|uniref:phenylalanine--tRNA ligase subunit beta n=1 Tax=Floccifex sp. TaxID=2815810 RepID=UPI003F070439